MSSVQGHSGRERSGLEERLSHHLVNVVNVEQELVSVAIPRLPQRHAEIGPDPPGASSEHDDAICEQHRLLDVMSDEENALRRDFASQPQFHQLAPQVLGGQHIERGERFVHEENLRLDGQRPCKSDALLHAAGQLLRVGILEPLQSDRLQGPECAAASFLSDETPGKQRDLDVLHHGQPREQREALEHDRCMRQRPTDWFAVPQDLAARRRSEPREDSKERRLARTGGPEDGDDHPGGQAEVERRNHLDCSAFGLVKDFFNVPRLQDGAPRRAGANRGSFGGATRGAFRGSTCLGRSFDQLPPGFSGEVLEELPPGERIQRVENGVDLVDRPRAQEDVGVVIGKAFDERRRKVDRQRPKQVFLFFEREAHEGVRSDRRVEPSEERDGVIPARFRDKPSELVGRPLVHVTTTSTVRSPFKTLASPRGAHLLPIPLTP